MTIKMILASAIVVAAVIFGSISFQQSNVEYTDFQTAASSHKKFQVKGYLMKEKEIEFAANENHLSFYMTDERGKEMKVIYDGAEPNNFEMAQSIVVKGGCEGDHFHATEILTKCPSKYEADSATVNQTL
jgi:cytochrome c-type biogenesis protein CcmE